MYNDITREILSDYGYFYLGTIVDSMASRGIPTNGYIIGPRYIKHIVYMQDTNLLLTIDPKRELVSPIELEKIASESLNSDYEISYHELGDVISGILEGDMSYLEWIRLPILNQPQPEYLNKIRAELISKIDDCYLALVKQAVGISDGHWLLANRSQWMPLDYRLVQLLAFARTGKIEVNYFTALAHLQADSNDYQVYESAKDEIVLQHLSIELRNIETKARRGIL